MATKTKDPGVPAGYDPSQFPAFAVTVDVVILTMADGRLHVLLVRRGVAPFAGMWAIPGGFKRPAETLKEFFEAEKSTARQKADMRFSGKNEENWKDERRRKKGSGPG